MSNQLMIKTKKRKILKKKLNITDDDIATAVSIFSAAVKEVDADVCR